MVITCDLEFVIYVSNIFLEKMCYHREPWSWEYDFLRLHFFLHALLGVSTSSCGFVGGASAYCMMLLFFFVTYVLFFCFWFFYGSLYVCGWFVQEKKRYLWAFCLEWHWVGLHTDLVNTVLLSFLV